VKRFCETVDFGADFFERLFLAAGEGVSGVAIGAAEVAGSEADKNAGQPREGAFTLQAQVDFIDVQRLGHRAKVS